MPEADLFVSRGKIEGKSTFTRGLMIALNDVSAPARDAITRGKGPSFLIMNGHDQMMILSETIGLIEFLTKRIRLLAEKGLRMRPLLRGRVERLDVGLICTSGLIGAEVVVQG